MKVASFADLMKGHQSAEILNLLDGNVVRRLSVQGSDVLVDALTDKVTVPLTTEIRYDAWFMDRGSMLFACPGFPEAKICTELDIIRFPDGTEERIEP